jgi:hypothetical protein
MLYLFRLLLLLINIDQETVLNWFGIEDPNNQRSFSPIVENDYSVKLSGVEVEPSANVSLETLKLIVEGLFDKVQDGLTLADIENVLFFILFIRFVILAIRYNLKTSLYITGIGLFAAYLWYRHLIDLVSMYRNILIKIPFLHKLGMDAVQLRSLHRQAVLTDLKLGDNVHWYNPGQAIYYAFTKGIVDIDPETGIRHYIDPISMVVSNLNESDQSKAVILYYKIYNKIVPTLYEMCSKFWSQLSGIAAYAVITRIGKRYCPYLIRWHWTFLLIIGMVEQIFVYFIFRISYFQSFVLVPQTKAYAATTKYVDQNLLLQINALNVLIACIILAHIGLILFGMFHAIWGQYFYFPFFVENTELHVGPRPKTSLYSGGNTAWQDPEEKEKNFNRFLPKLWYGWFGRGTQKSWKITTISKKFIASILKKLKKKFRR